LAKKANCRAAPLSRLDRFIFCTAVCGKPGFCKEQAKEHTMYVTARATPARRGIDHNAKQKTLLKRSFAKPLWKKFHWGFSFARKKAWQRKRIVAPLRCRGLINLFFAQQYAASPGFARSKQRSILCM